MLRVTMDIEKVSQALNLSADKLTSNVANAIEDIVDDGTSIMKKEAPDGTGELRKSIEGKVEINKDTILGTIIPMASHAEYVEHGRPSGGAANVTSIKKWLLAKGISVKYAGAISKNIGAGNSKSNKPNPFVQRTFDKLKIVDKLEKAIKKTLGAF